MTQDEIIRMARDAGLLDYTKIMVVEIERFAALVADHEREKLEPYIRSPRTGKMNVSKHYEMQQAILAEREACAKVCEENAKEWADGNNDWCSGQVTGSNDCAAAIRARGENEC